MQRYKHPLFRSESFIKFIRILGFEPSLSPDLLVLPYDKPIKWLMIAREALVSKVKSKVEQNSVGDVEGKIGFPTFQKFSEVFGKDLSKKQHRLERDELGLTQDEAVKIFNETECATLEDYLLELGENTNEFQLVLLDMLGKSAKSRELVQKLRDIYLESSVLHKTAVFLRQCFADPLSRAVLIDAKDKKSKFARNLLEIDIMEAQGIFKKTSGRVNSIEDLVMLYCERQTYEMQKFEDSVQKIDN